MMSRLVSKHWARGPLLKVQNFKGHRQQLLIQLSKYILHNYYEQYSPSYYWGEKGKLEKPIIKHFAALSLKIA